MTRISFLMPSKYKSIKAKSVARAMAQLSKTETKGVKVFHYEEIVDLSNRLETLN